MSDDSTFLMLCTISVRHGLSCYATSDSSYKIHRLNGGDLIVLLDNEIHLDTETGGRHFRVLIDGLECYVYIPIGYSDPWKVIEELV